MTRILFENGKKVGEISDWKVAQNEPVYKTFLGKTVLSVPKNNECSFTSPKPVHRKSQFTVIEDGKMQYDLQVVSVKIHTQVTALIKEQKKVKA